MTQSCATCKYGRFAMTNHRTPRPKDQSGVCQFPSAELTLPECVTYGYGFAGAIKTLAERLTWPTWGANCPVWEAKEKG
jgi:hypothetical protein